MAIQSRYENGFKPEEKPENKRLPVPRSAHNLSREKTGNFNVGQVHVLDYGFTLPFTNLSLQYDLVIQTRVPTVRKLNTKMRAYIHTVWSPLMDLWEGANAFIGKGTSGTLKSNLPVIKDLDLFRTPMSVVGDFGIPWKIVRTSKPKDFTVPFPYYVNAQPVGDDVYALNDITKNSTLLNNKLNALLFVLYQKGFRKLYMNRNLIQNNKYWIPDNEEHFVLPFSAQSVNVLDYNKPYRSLANLGGIVSPGSATNTPDGPMAAPEEFYDECSKADSAVFVPMTKQEVGYDLPPILAATRYRQFKGDYFNSGSPFKDLLRGDVPVINLTDIEASIDFSEVFPTSLPSNAVENTAKPAEIGQYITAGSSPNESRGLTFYQLDGSSHIDINQMVLTNFQKAKINGVVSASLDLNLLRKLEAVTLMLERNARTDGTYNELIKAQFGQSPKQHNKEPVYIGGSYQDIVFNEVIQQSQSTDDSILGMRTSIGRSSNTSAPIKHYCNDYGYYITFLTIVPDYYYFQGIPREFTDIKQDDVYFPLLNNLPAQATLTQEIFVSNDEDINKRLFNYNQKFAHLKSRQNLVTGLKALGSLSLYDSASVYKRTFTEAPVFNNQFIYMSPSNLDDTVFNNELEPPFEFWCNSRREDVSPLPYENQPEGLGINL